jgi:hypothetical protein
MTKMVMRKNETKQPQNNEEDRDVEMGLTTHSHENNDYAIPEEEQEQPHRENLEEQDDDDDDDDDDDEPKNVADGYTQYHPATKQEANKSGARSDTCSYRANEDDDGANVHLHFCNTSDDQREVVTDAYTGQDESYDDDVEQDGAGILHLTGSHSETQETEDDFWIESVIHDDEGGEEVNQSDNHPEKGGDDPDLREGNVVSFKTSTSDLSPVTLSGTLRKWTGKAQTKLFGDDYSEKESMFVIVAGGLIAFNNGYVNGSCLSGLLSPNGVTQSVAGFTSAYTGSALAMAAGEIPEFGFQSNIILSYMMGAFIAGFVTPNATPYRIEPTYGPTFLVGGVFLLIASILAALEFSESYIFFFAAAANGIQNGIASIYSANLIRCSLTGSSTDIALVFGQLLRGNRKNLWKGLVLVLIVCSFWLGGLVSFYATSRFRSYSLFFNAGLFWVIGMSLVFFLVHELRISVRAAIFGTWEWKQALRMLHRRMIFSMHGGDNNCNPLEFEDLGTQEFGDLFDRVDKAGNGRIEETDLTAALHRAGVQIDSKGVKTLIKSADKSKDGTIYRDEWMKMCRSCRSAKSTVFPSGR